LNKIFNTNQYEVARIWTILRGSVWHCGQCHLICFFTAEQSLIQITPVLVRSVVYCDLQAYTATTLLKKTNHIMIGPYLHCG
jgi:hypothetical protein